MVDWRRVQQVLMQRGYDLGPAGADGIPGRMTQRAVAKFQTDQNLDVKFPGTVGPITLAALGLLSDPGDPAVDPPWVSLLRQKMGLHEKIHNRSLREWLKSDGNTLGDPAQQPWCGDLVETIVALSLPLEPMIANPYWALNWAKFGVPCPVVALGAIAALVRPGGGHVGIVLGHDREYFHLGGGNQQDAISIVRIEKSRLRDGLRWPRTWPLPDDELAWTSIDATVSHNEA